MGIDEFKSANRNRSSVQLRRKQLRSLLCENLERRDLMAAHPIFAPGTSQSYMDQVEQQLSVIGAGALGGGGNGGGFDPINLQGSRWTNPTGGPSPNMGDPATISWSIVADGTRVSTLTGGLAPSNLVAFMDGIYGGGTGPVANRPWFNIIQRAYDNWAAESGLTFIYEPNDDGADYSNAARGVRGVRGDVRIGGNNVDGDFNVLAFNFYPNGSGNAGFDGDMVIDTADRFYRDNANGATGENRGFSNVLMHEAGHGLGLGHVIPIDNTKLMEPIASFAYLGAQYDDILGVQTLYGDNDEPNDSLATAKDLGTLTNGVTQLNGRSIDRNGDVDLFKFTIDSAGILSLTVSPNGRQYNVGPQGGTAAPSNTFLNKDLSFQIEQSDGRVLTTVSAAGLGLPEVLSNFALPGAGTYVVRVLGAGAETQPYSLRMTLGGISSGGTGPAAVRAPRLLSVAANSGENFSTTRANGLSESPRELTFRFDVALDPATLAKGIRIQRSGGDGVFGSASTAADSIITPAYLNFGENERIVVARFAQPLQDDTYRIEIFGVDLPSESAVAIRNLDGQALRPQRSGTDRDTFDFDLELGTKIIAVVPQPVDRVNGVLVQRANDIEVYFNDAELYNEPITTGNVSPNPTVVDPLYYNLILTKDTVSSNDDLAFNPISITYDPLLKKATLSFANNLDQLPGVNGAGTFRLRVGSNEAVASMSNNSVVTNLSPLDPAGNLAGAVDLGVFSATVSTVINQEIRTVSNPLLADFPGSNFEPGHRDIQDESHQGAIPGATADTNVETTTIRYSFMDNQSYGNDIAGRPLFSSISPEQKQRVREIFEFYSAQLGLDAVEFLGPTINGDGIKKIVVGDMAPNGAESGPGDVLGVAALGGELAIMDGAEAWDNTFGYGSNIPGAESFFETALHEVGHLLGLGHTYDLPPGTIQGSQALLGRVTNPLEQIFPGDNDVVHGQHIYRPDNRDVDLYRFVVQPGSKGELRAETFAERLNDSSTLDTYLTLLRKEQDGTLTVVAANNNYFSDDSLVRAVLEPGEYFLSVTGKGNEDNDPLTVNSGSGGVSQGRYQLRVDFKSTVASQLAEQRRGSTVLGSALDGDGDGIAGGNFDFWFRAATAFTVAGNPAVRTLLVDKAFTGTTRNGSLANPFNRIVEATTVARPGDIIRLVGDTRTPNNLTDDIPYEIGDGGGGIGTLRDGSSIDVPRGVTMMIDAGAILKFGGSRILVGSNDSTTNRSGSAIQVLGIPGQPVYFTSYFDEALGRDTNSLTTIPAAGQWGGIEIRNDFDRAQGRFDREREGIFLNTISNADMRFGGGIVGVGANSKVVSPIDLSEARPLILGNRITSSGDSAISADPNSFEESLFTETRDQNGGAFAADYSRVGPDIRSNTLLNNSINGLFVRIDTLAGQNLKPLSVPARMNDSEITIVLGENLVVEGTPGGPLQEGIGPNISLLSLTQVAPTGGSTGFAAGRSLNYLITYFDRFGQESLPSSQATVIVAANQSIQLSNIPSATLDYVGRKIWRQENNTGAFRLAGIVNRDDTSFVDNGLTLSGTLQTQGLTQLHRARRDASLVIDPGMVIKSLGGRIEVGVSGVLLAEGSESKPIVFTSRLDDRYGAAGNFDTNNDGSITLPSPGNWAGIVSRHLSELSIDHSLITFAGGDSRVRGGFASFNAIEIHQSTARIANSVIEENASGFSNPGTTNRDARGVNDEAVIFVVGSQPIILNNIVRNNSLPNTAAISIDANSLNTDRVRDYGRSTGLNQRENVGLGNFGPLVNNNQLGSNSINGMSVRGATLTTESVWDDTDMVHVLQNEIVIPDFHTYGGLRLMSKADESLVVKLDGGNAGFTATGRPLDIKDRIGGSLQLLGSPGFPVVLTSLSDDTIGAGFDFSGRSLVDTNNNGPSVGAVGGWRSVRVEPFSNDRNVDQSYERESDQIADEGVNDFPSDAQELGSIASSLTGGDENLRLGVTVTGAIASPSDIDVYRFVGTAGTMLWIDVDQTSGSLDSVVELIDGNGQIIALSNNSIDESTAGSVYFDSALIPINRVFPMDQRAAEKRNALNGTQVDFLGVNPLDAGLRVVLPGSAGSVNNYYVRVRSSNVSPVAGPNGSRANPARLQDPGLVREGITVGQYKLQLRLQQTQEVSGTTVRFADIRFASTALDILGQPLHSALVGEMGESDPNETSNQQGNIQNIGNVASSDRGAISVAGRLAAFGDIDYYRFSVSRDSIQQVSTTASSHISVIIDLDYADGQGRANTQLSVFDSTGRLVLIADDSNIHDDQPAATRGSDVTDLTRGSQGTRDAFLGPIELPAGNYVLAVSNKAFTPTAMRQFTDVATSTTVRVEPIDSVRRILEERFDSHLAQLFEPLRPTTAAPPEQPLLIDDPATFFALESAVPFNLSDVTLFGAIGRNVTMANPLTGSLEAIWSTNGTTAVNFGANTTMRDLAVTPGGQGVSYQQATGGVLTDANQGTFISLDLGNGTVGSGTSGLITTTTRQVPASNPATFEVIQIPNNGGNNGVGMIFDGLAFSSLFPADHGASGAGAQGASFWGVASRNAATGAAQPIIGIVNGTPTAVGVGSPVVDKNILYRLSSYDANNAGTLGTALDPANTNLNAAQRGWGAGTGVMAHGFFVQTPGTTDAFNNVVGFTPANGTVSGLASVGTRLFAVTNQGELMGMSPSANQRHVFSNTYAVINDPETNLPIAFSGLTAGPRSLVEGSTNYSQLLFGVSTAGRLYAFNTAGQLQNIFPRGRSFVNASASLAGATGISFSSADSNLFHLSLKNELEAGHGRVQAFNNSSDNNPQRNVSLRFGYSDPGENLLTEYNEAPGIYRVPSLFNTFAAPGGAKGAIESQLLDLRDYSPDDQPYLYFNYRLDNENRNSAIGDGNNAALDTFRVYGRAEDGKEVLLATNNTPRNNSNRVDFDEPRGVTGADEFDVAYSENRDAFGREKLTAELFDNVGWRQARVSLSAFAGKQDVRLRFEYASGGDFRTGDVRKGGLELIAVPGERIKDGDSFTILDPTSGSRVFEFDLGLVLNIPSGVSVKTGDQIVIGADTFTFSNVAGPTNIPFAATNTPAQLALSVSTVLSARGFSVATSTLTPNVLNVTAKNSIPLLSTATYSILGAAPSIIIGRPGTNAGAVSVSITNAMTAVQVRDAVRVSLARGLNIVGQETNVAPYRVRGNSVLVHDSVAGMEVTDPGPLTVSRSSDFALGAPSSVRSPRVGDDFGPRDASGALFAALGGQNNRGLGVQIDDIIIGFAERGESVFNSQAAGSAFTATANYEPILLGGALPQNEVEIGTYQVEVRTAAEYGLTRQDGRLYFFDPVTGFVPSGRSFGTNDRLTKSFALVVDDASRIVDGATFTLSDGINTQRFEFDVITPGDTRAGVAQGNLAIQVAPNASAVELARAIRDAINSPIARANLNITASNSGDTEGGGALYTRARSAIIQLNGQVSADALGGFAGFSSGGVPLSVIEYGQDTTVLPLLGVPFVEVNFGEDLGDSNSVRQQGQVIISSSVLRDSRNFGLNIDAAAQGQAGASSSTGIRPYPGAARNLVTLNSSNVAPGVVVMNNVIASNGAGGIRISGDTANANGTPPFTVARVINNTLYGLDTIGGTGILVEEGAAPSLLNNIVSNFTTGISVNGTSVGATELGANIYKQNGTNVNPATLTQSFEFNLSAAAPLFIDAANKRFYLRSQSLAIDSSIASLENRSSIEQVKEAVGIPTSPILAPSFDVNGLRRGDDPTVNTPAGQGQNVFIDRGAIDRVDFVGPIAVLQRPLDNDSSGLDRDPADTYLQLRTGNYDFFEVLLDERTGTGTDPNTITENSLILTENGRPLVSGVDYVFGFSANSRTIRLTPLAGFWRRDSIYEITLINKPTIRIDAQSGAAISDANRINVTTSSGGQASLEYDSGYVISVPQTLTLMVPAAGSSAAGITDGQTFQISFGSTTITFEFDSNSSVAGGNTPIAIAADQSPTQVRDSMVLALKSIPNLNLAVASVGSNAIHLGAVAGHVVDLGTSRLTVTGVANGIADGQRFVFDPVSGPPVTFEFNVAGDANFTAGNRLITFNRTDTYLELATKIAAVVAPALPKGFAPAQDVGGGSIYIGGMPGDVLDVSASRLAIGGTPGVTAAFNVAVPAAGGSGIGDGSIFSIRSATGQTVVFEFNKDAVVNPANRGISIRDTDTADQVAAIIATSIAGAPGLGLVPTVTGRTIRLNEPRGTAFNVLTSPLVLTGVSGGAIPIPFVPGSSFTSGNVSSQIFKALSQVGLGVRVYSLGYNTLIIEGVSSVAGIGSIKIDPPISDLAANWLQPNRANSLTQFTILMPEVNVDFGDAIERSGTGSTSSTLLVDNGVRHGLYPDDVPVLALGRFADADLDGRTSLAADADDFSSAYTFSAGLPLFLASKGPAQLSVSAPVAAMLGKRLTISDALNKTVTYQFTDIAQPAVPPGIVGVDLTGVTTANGAAGRLQAAILVSILAGDITGIHSTVTGNVVSLGGSSAHTFDLSASGGFVQRVASGSVGLSVPASVSSLAQGQTFSIQDGSGNTVVFQIIDSAAPASLIAGNTPLVVEIATASQSSFAAAVAKAINDAIAAGKLRLPAATVANNTVNVQADDEDGVQFTGLFNSKAPSVEAVVTSTDAGYLDAWIDWNQDNDFDDAGEQIVISAPVVAGQNAFNIVTPANTISGYTTARFRLSATGGLFTYGLAIGGEVEDYIIEVLPGEPPVAVDDPSPAKASKYRVNEDGSLIVIAADGVLSNDSDIDSPTFSVFDSDPAVPGVQPAVGTQNGVLVLQADGSFTYAPNADFFGTDTFVYQVTDPRMVGNKPATVTITVSPINDVPRANNDSIAIDEDTPQVWNGSLFTGNDFKGVTTVPPAGLQIANESGQNLRIKSIQRINPDGSPATARTGEVLTLTNNVINFTPGSNYNSLIAGNVLIRLEVEDDGVSYSSSTSSAVADPKQSFSTLTVTINPVNDRPIFTLPSSTLNLTEDPTPANQVFTNFLTNVFAGPLADIANGVGPADDELGNVSGVPGQSVTFAVRALDPTRFTTTGQPAVSRNGTNGDFTFTLAPDVNSTNSGPILVEIIAQDGTPGMQSVARTVTINVAQVNDPPSFTLSTTNLNVVEDAPRTVVPSLVVNPLPGPSTAVDEANQTFTTTIVAANPQFYSVQPRLTGTGDLEFQLAADVNSLFNGSLNILITLADNGTPSAAITKTLTITVADINDSPTFTLNSNSVVVQEDEQAGITPSSVAGFASNLLPGPATALDEVGQVLTFNNVSVSNPTLFSQLPSIDSAGTLTFKSAADRNGTSIVVVRLVDNGRAGPPPNSNLGPTATFTITVNAINDAPEFALPTPPQATVAEDQGVVSIPGFINGIRPGPSTAIDETNQILNFVVRAEDPSVFLVQPTIQNDGTLVFQTARDINNDTTGILRRVFVSLRDNGLGTPSPNDNLSDEQVFTINITPVNDPPIPDALTLQGVEDQFLDALSSEVLLGDLAGPADEVAALQQLRITQIERTTDRGGVVTPVFSGDRVVSFRYVPPANLSGADFVRYVVTDDGLPQGSATGTITIQLAPINDPPQFIPGTDVTVPEDTTSYSATWATGILAGPPNATDENTGPNAQTITFELVADNPSLFSVLPAMSSSGVLTFSLAKDAIGRAIVDVTAIDSGSNVLPSRNRSTTSRLTITANPVNDAPGFIILGDVSVLEDSSRYSAAAISNIVPAAGMNSTPPTAMDEAGQSVVIFTSNSNPNLFSVQPSINSAGILEFVPAQDAFGSAIVSVFGRDNGPNTPPNVNESTPQTFTIVIRPTNDAPVGVNDRYSVSEDGLLSISAPGVLSNDRDVDLPDDQISVNDFQATSNLGAIVVMLPNGQFTYDPRNAAQLQRLVGGQIASDTFTYVVRDRDGVTSNVTTVTVSVSGENDNPVAVDDSFSVPLGVSELLNVLANDRDIDTSIEPGTVEIGQLAANGTAIALSTGRIEYRPNPGYRGPDSFTYRVRDSLGAFSNEARVQINVNSTPVALADSALTPVNTPVVIDVLRNDGDPDGTIDRTSVSIVTGPDVGTATVEANGTIRYVPQTGFFGIANLQYAFLDNDGLSSNIASVTIRVTNSLHQNPVNNLDVNADGFVSPIDVLIVVNDLNFNGSRVLPNDLPVPPYLDVNGDRSVGPLDVLELINFINSRGGAGAGEGEASMARLGYSQTDVSMVPTEEVVRVTSEFEQLSRKAVETDAAVLGFGNTSVYGPVLQNRMEDDEDAEDSLASTLVSMTLTKTKKSANAIDSCFADEDWM